MSPSPKSPSPTYSDAKNTQGSEKNEFLIISWVFFWEGHGAPSKPMLCDLSEKHSSDFQVIKITDQI